MSGYGKFVVHGGYVRVNGVKPRRDRLPVCETCRQPATFVETGVLPSVHIGLNGTRTAFGQPEVHYFCDLHGEAS